MVSSVGGAGRIHFGGEKVERHRGEAEVALEAQLNGGRGLGRNHFLAPSAGESHRRDYENLSFVYRRLRPEQRLNTHARRSTYACTHASTDRLT